MYIVTNNYSLFIFNYSLRKYSFRHSFQRLLHTPAAGYRYRETGALTNVGDNSTMWSSSSYAAGNNNAGDLWCHATNVKPLDNSGRAYGFSVRCVQHLPSCLS